MIYKHKRIINLMNKYIILLFLLVAVSTEEIKEVPVEGAKDIIEII